LSALNAQQSYVAANEQLIAATESYRIIQAQFKLGGTNTYEVLQLRNQYVQSIQAYTQTKYTAVLQQKIYEFYLGKPITF
jgi:outer membrane protein